MVKGKRGWIKVVEAFTALLIIIGVVITLIGEDAISSSDYALKVYEKENLMIEKIQLNNSLRKEIISLTNLPITSEDESFPEGIKTIIEANTLEGLKCAGIICELDSSCNFEENLESDEVYVQVGSIFAESNIYSPKQIKIFCFESG